MIMQVPWHRPCERTRTSYFWVVRGQLPRWTYGKGSCRVCVYEKQPYPTRLQLVGQRYKMLSSYCAMLNTAIETSFVSFDGDALRCAFSLALALRDVCYAVVKEWNNNDVSWRYSVNSHRKVGSYRLTVDDLLPHNYKMGTYWINIFCCLHRQITTWDMQEAGTRKGRYKRKLTSQEMRQTINMCKTSCSASAWNQAAS